MGAIGVPGYGWEAKIVGSDGETPVAKGEVGELALKGPGVMKEYYRNKAATEETLKPGGWLLTGDMAEERDGFIYLVDRAKDVIISGGENLYPVQIEDFLRTNPAVKDVAVIGLPDERLGEIAAAIIELKPEYVGVEATAMAGNSAAEPGSTTIITDEDVEEFCMDLPRYKRPRKIIFAEVPRNPTGKIEKPKLRERYGAVNLVGQESNR